MSPSRRHLLPTWAAWIGLIVVPAVTFFGTLAIAISVAPAGCGAATMGYVHAIIYAITLLSFLGMLYPVIKRTMAADRPDENADES